MNIQPIEKLAKQHSDLEVHGIFPTIQGEGPFCGTPCVFVRLTGCNLQCSGCDTEYTSNRVVLSPNTVVHMVSQHRKGGLVVITGGEPFRQPVQLKALVDALLHEGYYVQIETNGTLPAPEGFVALREAIARPGGVYVVVSPKTHAVQPSIQRLACCYKYVMSASSVDPEDGLPVQVLGHDVVGKVYRERNIDLPIYLQPMDSDNPFTSQMNLDACIKSCMGFGYILQLQIHKLIGVE